MRTKGQTTIVLQGYLDKMLDGDESYGRRLVDHSLDRLRLHVKKHMAKFPELERWVEVDDVLQEASFRLWRSLEEVRPATVPQYFGLGSKQIRRTLVDLVRRYRGKYRIGNHATNERPGQDRAQPDKVDRNSNSPDAVALSHEIVDALPEEQRQLYDLIHYHDVPQAEVAELQGISLSTLKRRWRETQLTVSKAVQAATYGDA